MKIVSGLHGCISLVDLLFAEDCTLQKIDGFLGCVTLSNIAIPAVEVLSVEVLCGCSRCARLANVMFARGCRIRFITGCDACISHLSP
jgi:hypothetical protein